MSEFARLAVQRFTDKYERNQEPKVGKDISGKYANVQGADEKMLQLKKSIKRKA